MEHGTKIIKSENKIESFELNAVGNPSVSVSFTLYKNDKIEHHIRINVHKLIVLRSLIKSGVNVLCG